MLQGMLTIYVKDEKAKDPDEPSRCCSTTRAA
jgi:hypothetical protein